MRFLSTLRLALFASSLALAACGGSTEIIPGGSPDAGPTGDAGQDSAPSSDGGSPQPDSGIGIDSGLDCDAQLAALNALQAKAQACCATCDIVQCYSAVPGMCCAITVNEPASPATQAFEAALKQYQAACPYGCPAIACPKAPTGICGASGECE
jgi:hypothetical protein